MTRSLCIAIGLLLAQASGSFGQEVKDIIDIIEDVTQMADGSFGVARTTASQQAMNDKLKYRSKRANERKTFTGDYVPPALPADKKGKFVYGLALFSDDGCNATVDGTKVHGHLGLDQHLPDLDGRFATRPGSFHQLPVVLAPGKKTSITVNYSNTIYVSTPGAPGYPDIDGCTLFLVLIPVDISIRKKGTTNSPVDGLLVMKGDVLQFALAPQFFDSEKQGITIITWHWRQLKGDGSFTPWTSIGATAKGTKFEQPAPAGQIFQVKAIITNAGEPEYKRKNDALHGDDSSGVFNASLRKDKPDYVGVVDQQWQISVRNQALGQLGSTTWSNSVGITGTAVGSGVDPTYVAPIGADKCNLFVFMQANAAGAVVPTRVWRDFQVGFPPWVDRNIAPTADQWNKSADTATGWTWLANTTIPQPGFVVSRRYTLTGTTHVGILDYDGTWINAGAKKVNKAVHLDMSFYQPALFRKK
ncbi:MAG TPA: hypothetical protein VIT23_00745 [Terrimicrobiaceae bacterium]